MKYPHFIPLKNEIVNTDMLLPPLFDSGEIFLEKGPAIKELPKFERLKESYTVPVLLKMKNNISTDEILEAGAKALPFRSNIPEISKWAYAKIDGEFYEKAQEAIRNYSGHIVVAGENYAQGSSREHAAMCPRYLGQVAVLAKSYARLGWQNLVNFGIIPFVFENKTDYKSIGVNDIIQFENLVENFKTGKNHIALNKTKNIQYSLTHNLSGRQIKIILEGGMINYFNINQKNERK